jgi:hypothetical protein
MPEQPRISVHDYVDARLDEQDARVELRLEEQDDIIERHHLKNIIELKQLVGWFLMLSAPSWADLVRDFSDDEVAVTVLFICLLFGFSVVVFYRTRNVVEKKK